MIHAQRLRSMTLDVNSCSNFPEQRSHASGEGGIYLPTYLYITPRLHAHYDINFVRIDAEFTTQ